jgi:hypothetical protein
MHRYILFCISLLFLAACEKSDTLPPVIYVLPDAETHLLGIPYVDAGVEVLDNHDCDVANLLATESNVDVFQYGSYQVSYTATDQAGNTSQAFRDVDIQLAENNYFNLLYAATDSCSSGVYSYTGLIQDCDCDEEVVTVANISNFGLSATFQLPLSGQYNELLLMDTSRLGVSFNGIATMSRAADTLRWIYVISTADASDACSSTWIKQ